MGVRGPRPDAAQAAKGFPGRRRSKAERAAIAASRLVELLAPAVNVQADLPGMLQDPKYAPAATVWRKLAPELRRTHRLPMESEFFFVQLCVYAQEWVEVTEDLHTKGFSQNVPTVAGGRVGKMERRRPQTLDRQQAFANCMELAGRFGLTPNDLYSLFKGQAAVAATNPGLFGDDRKPAEPASEPAQSRIGGFGRLRSPPPLGDRPN